LLLLNETSKVGREETGSESLGKVLNLPRNLTKLEENGWKWMDTTKLAGYWRLYAPRKDTIWSVDL